MIFLVAFLMLLLPLGQSVTAFSDLQSDKNADKINALKKAGIFKGEAHGIFNPRGNMTYAAGVSTIVDALNLEFPEGKKSKASDSFTHIKKNAWYSEAFAIAKANGLDLPKDVKPQQNMSREHFAHLLLQAIEVTGPYGYTKMYFTISDAENVTPEYANSLQLLLNARIIELDKNHAFKPKAKISRSDAAEWLYNAREFVKNMQAIEEPNPLTDQKLHSNTVNAKVNEITVTAQVPHPGYGIKIKSIVFEGDQAIIYTEAIQPDKDQIYPMVITEVSVTTFISSEYKAVLAQDTLR